MKKIWKFERTGGIELEVQEDFPVSVPFTDKAPIEGYNLNQQFFDTNDQQWKLLFNVKDIEELEEKIKAQSVQLFDVQSALVELYESALSI